MNKSTFLRFENYLVENLKFTVNYNFDKESKNRIIPELAFGLIKSKDDSKKFNVIIGFSYNKENNQPFLLEGMLRGFFTIGEDGSEEILLNAFAILFPYVRSLITEISRYSSIIPIIIPTINITKAIEDLNSIKIDSSNYREPL